MPRWPESYQRKSNCPKCGVRKNRAAALCRACTPSPKPLLGRTGPAHPAWKGGRDVDRDGYIRTYAPNHPWPRQCGYVREHVRIMELSIGRRIKADEVVHHRDHDRQNNSLANLELMSRGRHSRLHRAHDIHLRHRDLAGRFA
jgi:hypothetical protein